MQWKAANSKNLFYKFPQRYFDPKVYTYKQLGQKDDSLYLHESKVLLTKERRKWGFGRFQGKKAPEYNTTMDENIWRQNPKTSNSTDIWRAGQ